MLCNVAYAQMIAGLPPEVRGQVDESLKGTDALSERRERKIDKATQFAGFAKVAQLEALYQKYN